jgi:hypothetical protein
MRYDLKVRSVPGLQSLCHLQIGTLMWRSLQLIQRRIAGDEIEFARNPLQGQTEMVKEGHLGGGLSLRPLILRKEDEEMRILWIEEIHNLKKPRYL